MKKYFFTLIFVFSMFFLGFSTNNVNAAPGESSWLNVDIAQADQYDNRILNLTFSNYHPSTYNIRVSELRVCLDDEDGCEKFDTAVNDEHDFSNVYMKLVGEAVEYRIPDIDPNNPNVLPVFTHEYTIKTQSDGEVFLLITSHQQYSGAEIPGSSFIVYTLSTLNQRVVINPDAQGVPTYSENNVQYTAARNNSIKITLFEDEYKEYSGDVYVCEYYLEKNNDCLKYTISDNAFNYYLKSYGDGEKIIRLYLIKEGKVLNDLEFNDVNSTLVTKSIILDTIGPKITIDGGQWIYVPYGSRYEEQNATCLDAVFSGDSCTVKNDLKVVRIDYTNDKYQLITYEATDRLGNTSSLVVKVKVEIPTDDSGNVITLVISGLVLVTTFTILGIAVYKNHQKKKKLSYI